MKLFLSIALGLLTTFSLQGQDITGKWFGVLAVQGTQLRLVFNISQSASGYSSTMDSPDQGAKGIPVTSTTFDKPILKMTVDAAQLSYTGELKGDSLVGTFKQGTLSLPMNLSRNEIGKKLVVKPQEPVKPYPYYSEEVTFNNPKANISLAGTLTLPQKDGTFPAVVHKIGMKNYWAINRFWFSRII